MTRKGPVDLSGMDRSFFEALSPEARVELLCRLHALAIEQEAGSGFLVATTVVRRPLRPGIGDLDWRGAPPRHRPHRNPQRAPGANPASSAAAKGSGGASLFRPSAMRTITRHSAPRAPRRSRC